MIAPMNQLIVDHQQGNRVTMADVDMHYRVRFDQTPSQVAVHEWEIGPHKLSAPPHKHEHEDEVFYVLTGEVTVMQDEDIATAGPGNYVVLPRGHFHTFWNAGDVPARMLVILAPGRLEEYFELASQLLRPDVPPDLDQLGQLVHEYGLTIQFERIPELMAKYGLESDVPPPGANPADGS